MHEDRRSVSSVNLCAATAADVIDAADTTGVEQWTEGMRW